MPNKFQISYGFELSKLQRKPLNSQQDTILTSSLKQSDHNNYLSRSRMCLRVFFLIIRIIIIYSCSITQYLHGKIIKTETLCEFKTENYEVMA